MIVDNIWECWVICSSCPEYIICQSSMMHKASFLKEVKGIYIFVSGEKKIVWGPFKFALSLFLLVRYHTIFHILWQWVNLLLKKIPVFIHLFSMNMQSSLHYLHYTEATIFSFAWIKSKVQKFWYSFKERKVDSFKTKTFEVFRLNYVYPLLYWELFYWSWLDSSFLNDCHT